MIEDKMEWETVKMTILQQKSRNQDKIFKAQGAWSHQEKMWEWTNRTLLGWSNATYDPCPEAQKVLVGKPRPFRTQQKS